MTSPCDAAPDVWMSENPEDIERAKDGCLDCPLSRFNACQSEGWRHEFGVFGGLSHVDRERIDPKRYAALSRTLDAAGVRVDKAIIAGREADPRDKAFALLAVGATSREVEAVTGVKAATVRKWAQRSRQS
ncbi:hypothetical protein GCM10029963_28910 [Micromonospora andamanensis]|uniref:WhiB family transcriptional regulator n=1 Tax=Micromonospora andamanensis TaxID=1287068 RepID=UPI001A4F9D1A|nr:WhiB family transcriptional regulator [Micromonospora andamanensis]GIJ38477.1 hypothetical protein Vwe01_18020 [Micromonospora andamanensis]